jgi:sulfide:quinone oxidoreductase
MKNLLILGAGTAGTIMANKMYKKLRGKEWSITVVEKEMTHYYQPGFLFVPFGFYTKKEIERSTRKFLPQGVNVIHSIIENIHPSDNNVILSDGKVLSYDILIIATGTRISPEDTLGLKGELWYKNIFDFYTAEGADALVNFLKPGREAIWLLMWPIILSNVPLLLLNSHFFPIIISLAGGCATR